MRKPQQTAIIPGLLTTENSWFENYTAYRGNCLVVTAGSCHNPSPIGEGNFQTGPIRGKALGFHLGSRRDSVVHPEMRFKIFPWSPGCIGPGDIVRRVCCPTGS